MNILNILPYTPKDPNIIKQLLSNYFSSNIGFNPKLASLTGFISTNNKILMYSAGINMRNGRVLMVPYESTSIGLFDMNSGHMFNRDLPVECKNCRYINAHIINNNVVVLIPADSNTPVLFYDAANNLYKKGNVCSVNGDIIINDIFCASTILPNGKILCVNKNTHKPYIYDYITDTWDGLNNCGSIHSPSNSGVCITFDELVVLTNRKDVNTGKYCLQIFDYKNNTFRSIDLGLEENSYISCLPGMDTNIWLIPFNSKNILNLSLKDMSIKIYPIPDEVLDEKYNGISLGACYEPNGNIFISPLGIPYALEFNIITKKFTPLPLNEIDSPANTRGAILMNNGFILAIPGFRKSGIVYGTESSSGNPDIFINHHINSTY